MRTIIIAALAVTIIALSNEGHSENLPKRTPEQIAVIRTSAEKGDPFNEDTLGSIYALGNGLPKDGKHAFDWWKKAADQDMRKLSTMLPVRTYTASALIKAWRRISFG